MNNLENEYNIALGNIKNLKEELDALENIPENADRIEELTTTIEKEQARADSLKEQLENEQILGEAEINEMDIYYGEEGYQKLQDEIENLSKKIDDVELNPEDLMYPEFDKDKQKFEELKEIYAR